VSRGRSRTSRRPRERAARGASRVGERYDVEVGPIAHGGHCVARVPTDEPGRDRVVFVRHALPGERVVVEITEGSDGDSFWRGDAVSVLAASVDRVPAPCPYAGPGACGGCDLQHVEVGAQRAWKATVVREQLQRLAGLDLPVVVEEVPPTLRWRTRMQYVALPDGGRGLHVHRSDEVVLVEDCLIDVSGDPSRGSGDPSRRSGDLSRRSGDLSRRSSGVETHETVATTYGSHEFVVPPDGFWQSHVEAPRVLVEAVLGMLRPKAAERVLDLYAGVGLFGAFLADAVGPRGRVVAVEGSRVACQHARTNLPPDVRVEHGPVERVLRSAYDEPFDLVVLDPPREGARRAVVEQVVDRAPRAVAYVACDPAALARDLATFAELGYTLSELRVLDLFPMTHHAECVALLEKGR
jgi:tRNA/tmRNA/rRNA uracil-C5-methylase (TrmA/RlmC/RlmD family)